MVRPHFRWVCVASCLLAAAVVATAPSALAQRKKPPAKKPAATAPAKPKGKAHGKAAAPPVAPAPSPPSPGPAKSAPPPPPPPTTKSTAVVVVTPPPPEGGPDEGPSPPAHPSERTPSPLLDVSLGFRAFQRHLRYSGDQFGALPAYDLNGAPAGVIAVEVFPYRTKSFRLGIEGSFEYAFALGSTLKAPPAGQAAVTYTTRASQFSIGARGDYYFSRAASLGLALDYGQQSYSLDLPPPTASYAGVPDVAYGYIRPSLNGRFGITERIAIFAELGYLVVLKAGEIVSETYFLASRSSANGLEGTLGGAYQLSTHLELRLALDYRRYSLTFNPQMTDPYIATGASDTFLGAGLSIAYRM